MDMTRITWPRWSLLAALALHAAPLAAQNSGLRIEVTPFASYRVGGDFKERAGDGEFELGESNAFGFMVNGPAGPSSPDGQWEILYARQSTEVDTQGLFVNDPLIDVDIEHFQAGGVYLFDGDRLRPFVAMTLGMSRFDPAPPQFGAESFFSASLGAGLQLNANRRFGVRIEARALTTFVDSDSNIFCSSIDGVGSCLIEIDTRTLTQWEARAGLVVRF